MLMLGMVLTVFYLGTLVVDLTRLEHQSRVVQFAADASSLAGATELVLSTDTDAERWSRSKRAVLAVIKQNLTQAGYDFTGTYDLSKHGSPTASGVSYPTDVVACESNATYTHAVYDNGKVQVIIERGNFSDSTGTFTTYEDSANCNNSKNPLANALRVTVTTANNLALFALFAGFNEQGGRSITRKAVGTQIS